MDYHLGWLLFNGGLITNITSLTAGSFVFICLTHAVFICPQQSDYFTTLAMSRHLTATARVWLCVWIQLSLWLNSALSRDSVPLFLFPSLILNVHFVLLPLFVCWHELHSCPSWKQLSHPPLLSPPIAAASPSGWKTRTANFTWDKTQCIKVRMTPLTLRWFWHHFQQRNSEDDSLIIESKQHLSSREEPRGHSGRICLRVSPRLLLLLWD